MNYVYDDGGRKAAGYKGIADDCIVRAIAIAETRPYQDVYNDIDAAARTQRKSKCRRGPTGARHGIYTAPLRRYLTSRGWTFVATMGIGTGCRVHCRASEVPAGRLILALSKHICACIDGTIRDNHDPRRDGTRCVYGYWTKA